MKLVNLKKISRPLSGAVLIAAAMFAASSQANAAITQADWKVAGDGAITRDTSSNLEWLDVSVSINQSFNYVSTQFGAGGLYSGFRYATGDEVATLFTNAGLNFTYSSSSSDATKVNSLISLVGATSNTNEFFRSSLWTRGIAIQTPFDYNPGTGNYQTTEARIYTEVQSFGPSFTMYTAATSVIRGAWPIQTAQSDVGSWLVRNAAVSPVPAPAAAWMFAAGLPLIGAFVRRRKA